jgi:hypothetical protein
LREWTKPEAVVTTPREAVKLCLKAARGHANIATTMDLYTHVMPKMQDEATSRVDAAWRAAIGKRIVGQAYLKLGPCCVN